MMWILFSRKLLREEVIDIVMFIPSVRGGDDYDNLQYCNSKYIYIYKADNTISVLINKFLSCFSAKFHYPKNLMWLNLSSWLIPKGGY